jgi:2'-hydroxyisoflavone reductase
MKILILGGTVFLGRALATAALAAGHEVTCAARGSSGEPAPGVTFVRIDRSSPAGLSDLEGSFDAAIDVARHPSHVRSALAALDGRVAHWSFVSTCSVYSDDSQPFKRVGDLPLHSPLPEGADESPETYGPGKVTCERLYAATGVPLFINRAGLIVGPQDTTQRFDYWISRLNRGGEILAPGDPNDYVQWIDVRDLAEWTIRAAETGLTGIFDGIGAPVTRSEFFAGAAAGLSVTPDLTWVDQEFLTAQGVAPWAGERSLPMWLPLPEYGGFMAHDVTPSLEAGLSPRPLAETARDTLEWLQNAPARPHTAGISVKDETDILAEWRNR